MTPRVVQTSQEITVWYELIPYTIDLVPIRVAFVRKEIERKFKGKQGLAAACGISRSTVSRFFAGRSTSLDVTLRILDALDLEFDDVARSQLDPDDPAGTAPAAAVPAQRHPELVAAAR